MCLVECNSNHKSQEVKVSIFKFSKDEEERAMWKRAIPRKNLEITNYTAVCRKHWPQDCKMVIVHGKSRPEGPPSVFDNIPKSCLSSPPPKVRATEKTFAIARNTQPDELAEFQHADKFVLEEIPSKMSDDNSVIVYKDDSKFVIQSKKFCEGIPEYYITISDDLTYTVYHYGSSCTVPSLSSNYIYKCKHWSTFNEIIRYVKSKELDHKNEVLLNQVALTGKKNVGNPWYSPETITRAFEYFCLSRSLYQRFCGDF